MAYLVGDRGIQVAKSSTLTGRETIVNREQEYGYRVGVFGADLVLNLQIDRATA